MNWGKWIMVAFVLFALFIGVLVTVCVRQDINLVSPDYYQEELAYQQQIERMMNTAELTDKPSILVNNKSLEVRFVYFNALEKGELKLFRPSDINFDRSFKLHSPANGVEQFDVSQLPTGMYKARMQWSMNGKEYFVENIINL